MTDKWVKSNIQYLAIGGTVVLVGKVLVASAIIAGDPAVASLGAGWFWLGEYHLQWTAGQLRHNQSLCTQS